MSREKLDRAKRRYLERYEDIKRDPDLNEGAKGRRIAPIYREFKAEERRLLDAMNAEVAEKAASKGRKAFEAPAMHGADRASVQMNYRHALDSVEGLRDPKDLDVRLERAVLTGDKGLARAVAYRANETGNAAVVKKYLENDKDAREVWEQWADAHADLKQLQEFGETLAYGYAEVDEPPEMRHPEARAAGSGGEAA